MVGQIQLAAPSIPVKTTLPVTPSPALKAVVSAPTPTALADSVKVASTPTGSIPANMFQTKTFDVIAEGRKNSTAGLTKANIKVPVKTALEPTIRLVEAVDPKIGQKLRKMDESDYALSHDGMKSFGQKHEIYAAWVAIAREGMTLHANDMVLDNHFWESNDAEKASILIHEMTHAGELPIISHFQKLAGTIRGLIKKDYGDPVEDRAYLKQWNAFPKLGITERDGVYWDVKTYLEDRKLLPAKA